MEQKTQLKVLGILGISGRADAYSLVLGTLDGVRRLPITIGVAEAQSIAVGMENVFMPRPIIHDVVLNIALGGDIDITELCIYKVENGVFFAYMMCKTAADREMRLEIKPSDGVAIAVRFKCPIYAMDAVMTLSSFVAETATPDFSIPTLEKMKLESLKELLERCVKSENYEMASRIRDIIRGREK